VIRERGRGDALSCGELADPDAGRVLDRDEERDLFRGDPDLACLAAELSADLKENRSQPVGDAQRVDLG